MVCGRKFSTEGRGERSSAIGWTALIPFLSQAANVDLWGEVTIFTLPLYCFLCSQLFSCLRPLKTIFVFLGNQLHSGLTRCVGNKTFLFRIWMSPKSQVNLNFLVIRTQVTIVTMPLLRSVLGDINSRRQGGRGTGAWCGSCWVLDSLGPYQRRDWWFGVYGYRNILFHRIFYGQLLSKRDQR